MSRSRTGIVIAGLILSLLATVFADEPSDIWNRRPQPWSRRAEPILSAHTTQQTWCQVVCYSPHVIEHDGKFRMWYLGTSIASRIWNVPLCWAR